MITFQLSVLKRVASVPAKVLNYINYLNCQLIGRAGNKLAGPSCAPGEKHSLRQSQFANLTRFSLLIFLATGRKTRRLKLKSRRAEEKPRP